LGVLALGANLIGISNTAVGVAALNDSTGSYNSAIGYFALSANVAGNRNVAVGDYAGANPTASANSIFIGNEGLAADTATIKIGTHNTQTSAFIAGIAGKTVTSAAAVLINTSTGQLGTVNSSRRYKEDIQPMLDMTAMLQQLHPVTFRYKQPYVEGDKPLEYGLIAEEVAEVMPDLVVFNEKGQPETVKYHLLPSFLLAGWQDQQKTIAGLKERDRKQSEKIEALEARLHSLEALLPQSRAAALK
jgi:hypothetical protein